MVTVHASPSKVPRHHLQTTCLHISSRWVCLGSWLSEAWTVSIGSNTMRLQARDLPDLPDTLLWAHSRVQPAQTQSRGGSLLSGRSGCWATPGGAQATLPEGTITHCAAQGKHQARAQQPQQHLQSGRGGPGREGSQPSQQALMPGSPAHMLIDQPQLLFSAQGAAWPHAEAYGGSSPSVSNM